VGNQAVPISIGQADIKRGNGAKEIGRHLED